MRVLTGTISHETSTFTPMATTWENYEEHFGYLRGQEILDTFRGTNTPVGGFIEGAEAHGFHLIPTLFAEPHPSGPTPRDIFDRLLDELLREIEAALPIDGVLLQLHGAMVAEGIDDGEGHVLEAVRKRVGENVPVLVQLDIHSNVSPRMVRMADVLIGRDTYPEVDQAERGRECADVLERILNRGLRPAMALHQIPMVWGQNQVTAHAPMKEAIQQLHRIEARSGVVCGSIATCFPLADVPDMGASVYVVTDDDPALARACADELGAWIFARRADWHAETPDTREALRLAEENAKFPVIFADRSDNPGGGSPGDGTGMLRAFVEAGLPKACLLYIVDPDAIARCRQVGVDASLKLSVGGKSSPMQGAPVEMTAEVVALSDGRFRYGGAFNAGMEGNMGPSAHIRQDGVHVILVTQREQPFDTAFARSLDLDPRQMRYIGVKSATHFRSGFESWAGAIYVVSEPCVHNPAEGKLSYHNLGRKLYPFDDI